MTKYVVAFTNSITGMTDFKKFDYLNDAMEFMEIIRKKGLDARVYTRMGDI